MTNDYYYDGRTGWMLERKNGVAQEGKSRMQRLTFLKGIGQGGKYKEEDEKMLSNGTVEKKSLCRSLNE